MYNEIDYFTYTNNQKQKIKEMEFQQPTKATLDFGSKQIDKDALYLVDFSKMTSVNDLVMILAAMHISFEATHPQFDLIKQFLNLDNPIKLNRQQPEQKEMALPKLKKN